MNGAPPCRSRSLPAVALALGAAAYGWTTSAWAGEPETTPGAAARVYLDWTPDAERRGCATRGRIGTDVDRILGRSATTTSANAELRVAVRFERSEAGWSAHMRLTRPGGSMVGTRVLQSTAPECDALDGPIALVIALALEAPAPEVRLSLPPSPAAPRAPGPDWRAQSRAGVVASGGLLPGFALGARLSLGAVPPGFVPIHINVTLWPEREKTSEEGRGGSFSAWHAGLSLCPTLAANDTAGVALCLGGAGGMLTGAGVGLDYAETPSRAIAHGRADVAAWVRLGGPFSLGFQAGAAVPFIRPRFVYTDEMGTPVEVHRPWPVVPQGALTLGFEVPPHP